MLTRDNRVLRKPLTHAVPVIKSVNQNALSVETAKDGFTKPVHQLRAR